MIMHIELSPKRLKNEKNNHSKHESLIKYDRANNSDCLSVGYEHLCLFIWSIHLLKAASGAVYIHMISLVNCGSICLVYKWKVFSHV